MSALNSLNLQEALRKPEYWSRLVETAVGNFLANTIKGAELNLSYWTGRNREVDFILGRGEDIVAIEVKSGRRKSSLPGMQAFSKEFKVKRNLLVGKQGIPLEHFFLTPPADWFT